MGKNVPAVMVIILKKNVNGLINIHVIKVFADVNKL